MAKTSLLEWFLFLSSLLANLSFILWSEMWFGIVPVSWLFQAPLESQYQ